MFTESQSTLSKDFRPSMSFSSGSTCPLVSETYCDTRPLFGKDILRLNPLCCFLGSDVVEGLDNSTIFWKSSSEWNVPTSEGSSHPSSVLMFIGGVEIGNGSVGSSDWGLSISWDWRVVDCKMPLLPEHWTGWEGGGGLYQVNQTERGELCDFVSHNQKGYLEHSCLSLLWLVWVPWTPMMGLWCFSLRVLLKVPWS